MYDSLSATMLVVITVISLCAHIYSVEYMGNDPHCVRFFPYLSLFTFFMLFLVVADNILQLFVGWEGVGMCPYLSINFWATRLQANKASILAVMANKVGDLALLLASALCYSTYKTGDFSVLNACVEYVYLSTDVIADSSVVDMFDEWALSAETRSCVVTDA